ncbi:MAG: hypothetical protein M3Z05_15455 [Gemmatimonadota bacterium]|nr:hypothetical protein [Gemmatimonadota bacterium]
MATSMQDTVRRAPRRPEQSYELLRAQQELAVIRRICAASGIPTSQLSSIECVKLLAREHSARGAMNAVLHRQQCAAAPAAPTSTTAPVLSLQQTQRRLMALNIAEQRVAPKGEQPALGRADRRAMERPS